MFEQFLNHIQQHHLCSHEDSILLAVSGGLDSMVMLQLFKEANFNVGVAHCNFQLREQDSDLDEKLVHETCIALGIPFFNQRFETESFAVAHGLSIQMAARELRYAWFDDLVKKYSYNLLATAHHFDDSMETVLLNITKGAATEGLTGIPLKNQYIIRPLLFTTRAQIEKYGAEKKVAWREDQSNLTDDYQRNFIRHHVIPKLREVNPSLESTWQQGIAKIQGDLELIHIAFEDWEKKFIRETEERTVIDKKAFDSFSSAVSVLWRFIKKYAFNFDQAREIVLAMQGQSGKRFLSPTHVLVIDREVIIITRHPQDWDTIVIDGSEQAVSLGPWKLSLSNGHVEVPRTSNMQVSIDADKLKFPLRWRKWQHGDSFQPLGMKNNKKLSDFLIDNKVSLPDKDTVTVLESEGTIVYVVGWRIDERVKISDETQRVLNISVEKV
ncbi:tRNA lysidine(34) synthetase TilS [Chryseolinea sp. H1M3-3]|uniref:tRNA lysidine(34) synthetase TilS n=1 Tax=Chryseolinea sp. H1M3-3 TaxID=3034144 RepID=UPI0023EC3469|nr:tRNA lysidine(34) synthetase TilS [Chryseolinea sp. H1M3-3]